MAQQHQNRLQNLIKPLNNNFFQVELMLDSGGIEELLFEHLEDLLEPADGD
jgi:hypothetical protein